MGVRPPRDILAKDDPWDYAIEKGKDRLDEYEADGQSKQDVFCCEGLQGPKAVRSVDKPCKLDHLNPSEQILVRRGNWQCNGHNKSLKGFQDA